MASRKKESEGIALLSMYNDEDDEEMEDAEEDYYQQHQQGIEEEQQPEQENEYRGSNLEEDARTNDDTPPFPYQTSTPSQQPPQPSVSSPQQQLRVVSSKRSGRGRLTIVDYGHDEAAMSPEPEVIFKEKRHQQLFR
ncbi:hypothetical protein QQP08_020195 [Theobroma cacao]|nr:hypothetical protein QQP08_020195 [Theobroma cacao]